MLTIASIAFSQPRTGAIETFFPSVAYIRTYFVQTQKIGTTEWEVFLRNPINNELKPSTFAKTGTGFFICKELDTYFVTAEHVANTTNSSTSIFISLDNQDPLEIKITDLIDKKFITGNKVNWITHPNADVAVVPIRNDTLIGIPYEFILNKLEAPLRQRNLVIYGFPLGLGLGKKISPISKKYNPSSALIELSRFDNNRPSFFFLADDPSISGLSGGPVVGFPQTLEYFDGTSTSKSESGYQVLGLVHGTINGDGGGGYGAIVPSNYILETIDSAPSFTGKHVYRYNDGKIWSEVMYKNGFTWEVISNYSKNGQPQEKGTLKDGNGTRNIYNESGKLEYIYHYKNGQTAKIEKR
jgi:hypothetical protein